MAKTEITLIILSPSSEVNKLTFSSLSTATTVGELRNKISAEVTTHPAPGRQRLIHRGHALIDANRTLKDIFTQETVSHFLIFALLAIDAESHQIDNSETLSLHLALPPEPTLRPGPSSTSANTAHHGQSIRSSLHSQGSPGISENAQHGLQGPENTSSQGSASHGNIGLPQTSAIPGQAQHVHLQGTLHNGQFPPQLQQAFIHFQAVNQQLAAQLSAVGANTGYQGVASNHAPAQQLQQSPFVQPILPQIVVQQQQQQPLRTTSGQPGPETTLQQSTQASQPENSAARGHVYNANTVPFETDGPNRGRQQAVRQSNQVNVNPNQSTQDHSTTHDLPLNPSAPNQGNHLPQDTMSSIVSIHIQSQLSAMEHAMNGGNPLPESSFDQAREMLRDSPGLPQDVRSAMNTRLDNLSNRANHLRQALNNNLCQLAQERAMAQRTSQGPQSSAVYVLSSPSGPQALLVSPSGLYFAPWQLAGLAHVPPYSLVHHHPHELPLQAQTSSLPNSTSVQQPVNLATQAQQPAPQQVDRAQVEQAQQQRPENQARDLLRILLPLGGHIGLLVRLFGFVYFFTAGAGWQRAVLLGLAASLVFIAQTGIFHPVIRAIWDPIRRHAEALVPLAGNERPGALGGGAGVGGNAIVEGQQPANPEPTPQQAAERLLHERERQNVTFLRQYIRRVERAIALFVASLVPGVGERHIAAREAAEAARQAEVRERAEQTQREEEEARQQQDRNLPEAAGVGEIPNTASGVVEGHHASEPEQTAPPPLVEI